MWRQAESSPRCPNDPRLDGKLALVTGGARGIGLETSRGLAARGAEIIVASRDRQAAERLGHETRSNLGRTTHHAALDLADLGALAASLDRIDAILAGRRLDILVANAGLWPTRYATSAQGHEIAFATNVLGHHALVRGLQGRDRLAHDARVVMLTGDIYILSEHCTPDYRYRSALGGQLAYCRSKLGNLWLARELARRFPELRAHAVHPGVIASQLGGLDGRAVRWCKDRMMLSVENGAQTSLFCATQPGLPSGSYFHNVMGRVGLAPEDPGADTAKASELWDRLEALAAPFLAARPS